MTRIAVLAGCLLTPVFAGELGPSTGTVEVAGMGGLNIGPSDAGNHPVISADMQVYLNRWVSVGAGGAWVPRINTLVSGPFMYGMPSTIVATADLYNYGGGAQLHLATESRVTPYFAGGAGMVRVAAKAVNYNLKASEGALAFNFGGGFRAAVTKHFGVRCEVAAFNLKTAVTLPHRRAGQGFQ